jgi:hypothetical protein
MKREWTRKMIMTFCMFYILTTLVMCAKTSSAIEEQAMITDIPIGLDEIIAMFGSIDNPRFAIENIVPFELPYPLLYEGKEVTHSLCHKLAVDNFVKAFTDIKNADLTSQVKNYGGIYTQRSIRGYASHPSTHAWGIAVDLEPLLYPLGSLNRFPDGIVKIFNDAGFFYGGDFLSRLDPMHFQLARAY